MARSLPNLRQVSGTHMACSSPASVLGATVRVDRQLGQAHGQGVVYGRDPVQGTQQRVACLAQRDAVDGGDAGDLVGQGDNLGGYWSASRWCTRNRELHTTSRILAGCCSGPRASSSAWTNSALGCSGASSTVATMRCRPPGRADTTTRPTGE